jgi:hypothetical protein
MEGGWACEKEWKQCENTFILVIRLKIKYNFILVYLQQDATLHILQVFYLETALNVLGATIAYHKERKQQYVQHLVFVTPLQLSAAIVEEMELL